jgi:pimeloyl-ACP methyl ester carboxylesterase
MNADETSIQVDVGDQKLAATLLTPASVVPGVLFVHGWGGSQQSDLVRAREIAALGCVCLTFDLRGHVGTRSQFETVTREHNLQDLVAAYDALASHPMVNADAIALIGSSYGAYLGALLTEVKRIRWLAMRVPALYRDDEWDVAKRQLDRAVLDAYRNSSIFPQQNRALRACAKFSGDALIVESQHDGFVPHETIMNYRAAFRSAQSLTYRTLAGADHALSEQKHQHEYSSLLVKWMTEMVLSSRGAGQSQAAAAPLRVIS